MAMAVLITHWILLFGWGLALNDIAGGYLYCRLAMPGDFEWSATPWLFTLVVGIAILGLGVLDRKILHLSRRTAFYPTPLFVITQLLAVWIHLSSVRH